MNTTLSDPANIVETTREGLLARCDFLDEHVPQLRSLVAKARGYIAVGDLSAAHGCLYARAVAARRTEAIHGQPPKPTVELHGLARTQAALRAEAARRTQASLTPEAPRAELTGLARTRAALEREARLRGVLNELKHR